MRRPSWWILVAVLSLVWFLVGTDCKGRPLREAQIVVFEVTPNPVVRGGSVRIVWQAEHVGVSEGVPYCTLQRVVAGEPEDPLEVVSCVGARTEVIDVGLVGAYIDYQFSALRRSGQAFETELVRLVIAQVGVVVAPASVTLEPLSSQDFTATVTGVADEGVTWDASCGSISGSGSTITFTAPSIETVCEVTATSQADANVSASAVVTVQARPEVFVSLEPADIALETLASQDFTATVTGTTDTRVNWSASCGSITGSGSTVTYTAPASVPDPATCVVTVTSVVDPEASATATVTVEAADGSDWVPDLVIAFGSGADSMDPVVQDNVNVTAWHRHVFDSLTMFGPDGTIRPWIATDYENLDPTTWRIALRDDVRFHDGTPMSAEDVAFSIMRASAGAHDAMRWYLANLLDATVIDDYTVDVLTATPDPLLPEHLAGVYVVPEALLGSDGASGFAGNPVGTGPYRFVGWQAEDHVDLESFADFWGEAPGFERVRLEVIPGGSDRTDSLLAGEVDIVVGVGLDDIVRVEASPAAFLAQVPGLELVYLAMDHVRTDTPGMSSPNPFRDSRVRLAVFHAIDIQAIIQGILADVSTPSAQLLTPFNEGYDATIPRVPYDPERARELLAEAGYPAGFGVVRFDTPVGRFRGDASVANAIAGMLAAVGIEVLVNPVPSSVFSEVYFESGQSTLALNSWSSFDTSDTLSTLIHCWDQEAGLGRLNRFWYCNPTVDALIASANALFDPSARAAAYSDIVSDVWGAGNAYVPLHIEDAIAAVREGLVYEMRADGIVLAAEVDRAD